jgi:hypothetical protein
MSRIRTPAGFAAVAALAAATALFAAPSASAANSPTFRDCSLFAAGVDPDFVQLSGVSMDAQGHLTMTPPAQAMLQASESSDPGDSAGHVTLKVTVTAPGAAARAVSGAGTGNVTLSVPLIGSSMGATTNTVSWAATFDNGNHSCPSSSTPLNTTPMPFLVNVPPGGGTCDVPRLKGKSVKRAKKALTAAGCRLGKVKGRGKVKRQSPHPGSVRPAGSKVNVKLG